MKRLHAFALLVAFALSVALPSLGQAQTAYPGDGTSPLTVAQWRTNSSSSTCATATPGSTLCARYFLVDNQSGKDSNPCYIDGAVGSTFVAATATARACKSHTGLMAKMPKYGNGRIAVVLYKVRSDATSSAGVGGYVDSTGTAERMDWRGFSGYRYLVRRCSDDLTNSTTDRVTVGGIKALSGSGTGGAFTVDAGASTSSVPFKTDTLTAKAAIGYRVRFTSGALNGTTAFISNNTTTALTIGTNLSGTPAENVTFKIEEPGCKFVGYYEEDAGIFPGISTNTNALHPVVGFTFTGSTAGDVQIGSLMRPRYTFINNEAVTTNIVTNAATRNVDISSVFSYIDEGGTSRTVGSGFRTASPFSVVAASIIFSSFADVSTTGSLFSSSWTLNIGGAGSYLASGMLVFSGGIGAPNGNVALSNSSQRTIGNTSSSARDMLIDGAGTNTNLLSGGTAGIVIQGDSNLRIVGITFNNVGANPAVKLSAFGGFFNFEGLTGSTGNTDIGFDFTNAMGATVVLGRQVANTVTGSNGDIRTFDSLVTAHTDYTTASYRDLGGNFLMGTAKNTSNPTLKFSGAHTGGVGAATSYMADGGELAAGLLAGAQKYVIGARFLKNLRVQCPTNALAANMTATLYKNGSATAQTVTVTTGATTLFTDVTHMILFAATDYLDIVLASTGAGVNTALCMATVDTN